MKNKRVAIVTGGTRGMGQAISIELAKRGNIVCAVYRSHEESAKYTLKEMKKYEQDCKIYQAECFKRGGSEKGCCKDRGRIWKNRYSCK